MAWIYSILINWHFTSKPYTRKVHRQIHSNRCTHNHQEATVVYPSLPPSSPVENMASSSSYSALLRRSKLSSYNPQIDQVYTTSSSHLARSNFGLKRPLPSTTTKTSPFVRITDLDSREGRTVFRKASRENSYVKRMGEIKVGLQSEAYTSLGGKKWDPPQIMSRFVPESLSGIGSAKVGGSIKSPQQAREEEKVSRTPNFLIMSEGQFDHFLESLEGRREEFKQFVAEETAKSSTTGRVDEDFDLYAHAQSNPNELVRLVERFLRSSSSSSSTTSPSSETPLPQIHPTLALQYATPTPLESALASPIPGRLLGPSPINNFNRSSSGPLSSYRHGSGQELYSSVLSTISPLNSQNSGGLPTTTFYPDASSIRSNVPGRANFRLTRPTINPTGYAQKTAFTSSGLRKSAEFRPATAEYEPRLLGLRAVDLQPVVDTPNYTSNSPALRHPIGSPLYSGSLPPDLSPRDSFGLTRGGSNKGGSKGSAAKGLSEYFDQRPSGESYKSLGVNQRGPVDLLAGRKKNRTKEEQERWLATRESLMQDRKNDNQRMSGSRKGGQKKGQGRKMDAKEALIERLQSLLQEK